MNFNVPLLFFQVILVLAASATAIHRNLPLQSAASKSQIRFAIQNNYDNTGPGAVEQQFAYNTYKTLNDALIGYLDDPDTRLPESDRSRAIQQLTQSIPEPGYNQGHPTLQRFYPKTVEEYTGYEDPKPTPKLVTKLNITQKRYEIPYGFRWTLLEGLHKDRDAEPYRLQKIQHVRGNPLSLAHYSRDFNLNNGHNEFYVHPKRGDLVSI